jgi:hypothetical protein
VLAVRKRDGQPSHQSCQYLGAIKDDRYKVVDQSQLEKEQCQATLATRGKSVAAVPTGVQLRIRAPFPTSETTTRQLDSRACRMLNAGRIGPMI